MEETTDPIKLIDLPGSILEKVVEILAKVGVELPALVLQLFLLVLVVLMFGFSLRKILPDWRNATLPSLLATAGLLLVAVGILFGMVSQAALPDRLIGRVSGPELTGATVDLLDFRHEVISSGGVDTQTGDFIAYYNPLWNGRARMLRINAPSCKPQEQTIPRSRLAAGTESVWEFPCENR